MTTFPTISVGAEVALEHDFTPIDKFDQMLIVVAQGAQYFGLNAPAPVLALTVDSVTYPTADDVFDADAHSRWVHSSSSPTSLVLDVFFIDAPLGGGQLWVAHLGGVLASSGTVRSCEVTDATGIVMTADSEYEQTLDALENLSCPSLVTTETYNQVLRIGAAEDAHLDGEWSNVVEHDAVNSTIPATIPSDADPINPATATQLGAVNANDTDCFGVTVCLYADEAGVVGPALLELEPFRIGPGQPQSFTLSPAISGPVAFGPTVTQQYVTRPDLSAAVYRRPDLVTPIVILDEAQGKQFLDQLNDTGSGRVTLKNDDVDLALVQFGDLIRFSVRGYAALTAIIEDDDATAIDPSEEAGESTTLSGRGHLAVLDEARVYPARGLNQRPTEIDRLFNWAGLDYDDTNWRTATSMGVQSEESLWWQDDEGNVFPEDWPWAASEWIWAEVGTQEWAPEGSCYFRKEFTVPEGTYRIRIYFTCDDTGQLYLDGQKLLDTDNHGGTPNDIDGADQVIDITPGTHLIAVHGYNVVDPEGDETHNPAGVLVAVFPADASGVIADSDPLVTTDSSWKIVEYPPYPPGMTLGEILRVAIEEAQDRGALEGVTLAFDDDVDSEGTPWPETPDIATKVGASYLAFIKELVGSYCDVWMAPAALELHAWVQDGRGQDRDVSFHRPADTSDPTSGNLQQLRHHTVASPGDALLVRWAGGWTEAVDDDAVETYGRRETLLSLGAVQSYDEAGRIADRQLDKFAEPRTGIVAGIKPVDDTDYPYLAFRVGDTVEIPDRDGEPSSERVIAIAVSEDDDGIVTYAPTFKDPLLDDEERWDQTMEKMADGTFRGDSQVATPVASTTYPTPTCCPPVPPDGGGIG